MFDIDYVYFVHLWDLQQWSFDLIDVLHWITFDFDMFFIDCVVIWNYGQNDRT